MAHLRFRRQRTALVRTRHDHRLGDEDGIALVTVLLLSVVMLMFTYAAIDYSLGLQAQARNGQNWDRSLAAAEAGVDDYFDRLQNAVIAGKEYWQYCGASGTTNPTGYPEGCTPPDNNLAFTKWVEVPGTAEAIDREIFTYRVDSTRVNADGNVVLDVRGASGNLVTNADGTYAPGPRTRQRRLQVVIRRGGVLNYIYFTQVEAMDPYPDGQSATAPNLKCNVAYPGRDAGCTDVMFYGSGAYTDRVDGPVHSNDAILVEGQPEFDDAVTTAWTGGAPDNYRKSTPLSSILFKSKDPSIPSASMKVNVVANLPTPKVASSLNAYGCTFEGPTRIVLKSNGKMDVWSPYSPIDTDNCDFNPKPDDKGYVFDMALPASGVVRVVGTSATNGAVPKVCPTDHPFADTAANRVAYPKSASLLTLNTSDRLYQQSDPRYYDCHNGDLFVNGTVNGRLTLSSANNTVIVGDLTYHDVSGTADASGSADMLGVIADNNLDLYHPVSATDSTLDLAIPPATSVVKNRTLHGAYLALQKSVRLQSYAVGQSLGTLYVRGSIAQFYRGPVSTGGTTGFIKDYVYDRRLRFQSPPYFLDATSVSATTKWAKQVWRECKVAASVCTTAFS